MTKTRNEIYIWTIAISIAVVWHIFIWIRFSEDKGPTVSSPSVSSPSATAPEFAYIPESKDASSSAMGADSQTLMTPVLFSLPSAVGFSKPTTQYSEGVFKELFSETEELALLEESALSLRDNYLVWPRHMDGQISHLLNNPIFNQPRTIFSENWQSTADKKTHFTIEGEIDREDLAFSEFELDESTTDKESWQAKARIEFNALGIPTQVFLEEPTDDPELNSRIIQNLYRWRTEGSKAASGHILMQSN